MKYKSCVIIHINKYFKHCLIQNNRSLFVFVFEMLTQTVKIQDFNKFAKHKLLTA